MPKSKCPKLGKRQNQNFWWLGFRHVPISDVCPKTEPVRFGLLSLNCPKSEQFWTYFVRIGLYVQKWNILSHLALWTFCFRTEIFVQKRNVFCLDFGCCPNTEPSRNGTKVECPTMKLVPILALHCNYLWV